MKSILNFSLFFISIFLISCSSNTTVSTSDKFEEVELPDGSIVLLNKNSEISYPKDFEERNVELKGEAYFEVVPNSTTFKVISGENEVTVLGTSFNVQATSESMEVEVSTGEVEMKSPKGKHKLRKGNRGAYHSRGNKFETGRATFHFKTWIHELRIEFKHVGREFKHVGKGIGLEGKKVGKHAGKAGKQVGKETGKAGKQVGKSVKKALK